MSQDYSYIHCSHVHPKLEQEQHKTANRTFEGASKDVKMCLMTNDLTRVTRTGRRAKLLIRLS